MDKFSRRFVSEHEYAIDIFDDHYVSSNEWDCHVNEPYIVASDDSGMERRIAALCGEPCVQWGNYRVIDKLLHIHHTKLTGLLSGI